MRLSVRLGVLAFSCAAALCVIPAAFAQSADADPGVQKEAARDAAAPAAPQIPWMVNCASVAGRMSCEAAQSLTIQKTGQLLLSVSVRIPANSQTGAMMLHLPHGMFLPEGVTMTIDANPPQKQAVQTCDPKGCYVGLSLDDALLGMLQTGTTLTIAFKSLEKKDISIPISLSGFKEAYAKLM